MLTQVFLFVAAIVAYLYFNRFKRTNLPPGSPFILPIFGHLPLLGKSPNQTFLKWSKRYGPIISVQLGSYPAIVINDAQLIRKAFKMSSFAGRPRIRLLDEISGQRRGIVLADGPKAMEQRKFIQKLMKDFNVVSNLNKKILDQVPFLLEIFEDHLSKPLNIKHAFCHPILNALWGFIAGEQFDKNSLEFQHFVSRISVFSDMSSPIEQLGVFIKCISNWLPEYSGFNKKVRGMLEIQTYINSLVKEHERTKLRDLPRDVIDAYLDEVEKTTDPTSAFFPDHGSITFAILDLFAAGVETSSVTLEWIIFYIAKYPNVQRKIQKEIDAVLAKNCLPSSDDRVKLPYIQAVFEEASRISSIAPLSLFHSALEDTVFNGYIIPKDTIIVGNIFAAHHDKHIWGDPEVFRPERFLDNAGNFVKSDDTLVFGYGKRSCIGNNLAKLEMFLFIVSIFQRYSITPVGNLPPECGLFGFVRTVHPFQVHVNRRD